MIIDPQFILTESGFNIIKIYFINLKFNYQFQHRTINIIC